MSTKRPPLTSPIHWILDWDGTITNKDTLDALVNIAAATKPTFPTHDRWESVVEAYMADYTATLEKLAPGGVFPTTIADEKRLLNDMKAVEQRSLDRVFCSQIFEGLTQETLDEGARKALESGEVALRPGCVDFLHSVLSQANSETDSLHILSVNWSRYFISSCLRTAGIDIDSRLVFANEFTGIAEGTSSIGEISLTAASKLIASEDKLHILKYLRERSSAPVVYVGDSWTDIECLLAADLGICIRDEPMGSSQRKLAEAFTRLGVSCPRLGDVTDASHPQIAWAQDFAAIHAWAGGYV
ncbi:HAD-like domain-containing protein [Ampelomyces quisqualis]|uniref:HAD-like domain-containing protein n=1 Tax=Ampelomyces quisqualis TaxID=50730 RepID=A0A6A5QHM4_AMPQU|nr:HAD-like domain-containing protein [Ampelomyces quisqualis]